MINRMYEHFYKRVIKCRRGGGGDPTPPEPQQVNVEETSAEAIQAQIDALPKILAAQQQYGDQFSQQSLDQYTQFAPQYAQAGLDLSQQYGGAFAQQVKDEQDILDPSRSAGSDAITAYLQEGPEGLSEADKSAIMEQSRNATSSRGLGESGFGALDETVNLFNARQNLKSRYINTALSAAGRLPAAGGQTVQGNSAAYGNQLVQNVSPSQIFGSANANVQSANQMNSSIYNTQSQSGGNMGGLGAGLGMLAGGLLAAPTAGMSALLGAGIGGGVGGGLGSMIG